MSAHCSQIVGRLGQSVRGGSDTAPFLVVRYPCWIAAHPETIHQALSPVKIVADNA